MATLLAPKRRPRSGAGRAEGRGSAGLGIRARSEQGKGVLGRDVLVGDLDRHADVYVLGIAADNVRSEQRSFVELHERVDVRQALLETRMERTVVHVEDEDVPLAAGAGPP